MTTGNPENTNAAGGAAAATPVRKGSSIFTKILLFLIAIVAIFLAVAAMQPDDFKISRSTTVSAPPEAVFAQVNDFHKWENWSPWAKLDPSMKVTYDGPESGKGSSYAWAGNNEVGEGKMTITDSHPSDLVKFKLEFTKPFVATNIAEFTFKPEGNQTVVTWTMTGKNAFIGKIFGLLMNMDKMVGGQFEQGLAKMKAAAEADAKKTDETKTDEKKANEKKTEADAKKS